MAECRYCTHLAWPELEGTSWEPIPWTCSLGKTYSDQPQECRWFSREVGSDDNLTQTPLEAAERASKPYPYLPDEENAVTDARDGLQRILRDNR